MPVYEVSWTLEGDTRVNADDAREAVKAIRKSKKGASVSYVSRGEESHMVVGFCEGCSDPIFDTDHGYVLDSECVYLCQECKG